MITLEIQHFVYPKAKPVSISFHTWQQRESLIIRMRFKQWQGIGEANPFKPITGDSTSDVIRQFALVNHMPLDPTRDDLEQLHNYLQHTITCPSLISAIDMAYHDLIGQIQGVPITQLYASTPNSCSNSITVFLQESLEATQQEAQRIYTQFPDVAIIKIKLKGNQEDIERCRRIRAVLPDSMKYVLDANQGFPNPQEAVAILQEIQKILQRIILIEEPCAKGHLEDLKFVKDNIHDFLVFADESAACLADVERIIAANAAHGVNIKLQKAGGIWPARKIANLCERHGLKIMVGAMIEGPIAITADAHFASSIKNLVLTDLDTDLDLPQFTIQGADHKQGCRIVSQKPGLGISLDEPAIARLAQQGDLHIIEIPVLSDFF